MQKIIDLNFRKQQEEKVEYLKPTKAALYGLNLRFKDAERREQEEIEAKKAKESGMKMKEQDSVYNINTQLFAKAAGNKNLMLLSKKRTVSNQVKKHGGKQTIKNRHAMPVDLKKLFQQQKDYSFDPPPKLEQQRHSLSVNQIARLST